MTSPLYMRAVLRISQHEQMRWTGTKYRLFAFLCQQQGIPLDRCTAMHWWDDPACAWTQVELDLTDNGETDSLQLECIKVFQHENTYGPS